MEYGHGSMNGHRSQSERHMRLERYTEKAQQAFQDAQELMQEMHHTQLDVEHIFLAMLRQPKGLTQRALEKLGVFPTKCSGWSSANLNALPSRSAVNMAIDAHRSI